MAGCYMDKAVIIEFDELYAPKITSIRGAVFTLEQGIDEAIDFDGQDAGAVHILVSSDGHFIGTGRMLDDGHIGRLAVLREHRGKGFGAMAVSALVDEARRRGMKRVYLGAQMHAVGFYKKLGFSKCGAPFVEAGIEHIEMERCI